MAVQSITPPSQTRNGLVSKVHSAYNFSVFTLNFDPGTTLLDKVTTYLEFCDASGNITQSNTYNHSVLNIVSMRRDFQKVLQSKIKIKCPLDYNLQPNISAFDLESFVMYRVVTVFGDSQTLKSDWCYAGAGVFQTFHEWDGNFIGYMVQLNFSGGKFSNGAIKFLTPFDVPVCFGDAFPFALKYISPIQVAYGTTDNLILNTNGVEKVIGISDGLIGVVGGVKYFPAGEYIRPAFNLVNNEVFLSADTGRGFQQVSETKKIENKCIDNYTNPICLVWLNSLGGWDVWVFDRSTLTTQIKSENYISKPIDSLQTRELGTLITRNETQSIVVSQNQLNENRYNCLQEIVKSPICYWWHTPTNYEQVQVSQSNFTQKSTDDLFTINLEISLFKVYNQF